MDSGSSGVGAGYFGSVGAIVGRDQHSFIVRQLTPRIGYIFQIQAIGLDGQTYGPASSLEFRISGDYEGSSSSSSEARLVDLFRARPEVLTTTPSEPDYYFLNNGGVSSFATVRWRVTVSVFLVVLLTIARHLI